MRTVNISAKTDYAIRALLMLAEAPGQSISVEALAQRQSLPRKFLEAIFADLRRGQLVQSRRGAHGGYSLTRPADQVMLGDIFRAVDGPLAEVRGLRPDQTTYVGVAEHLPVIWVALRASLRRVLDDTTLAQLLSGELSDHVQYLARDPEAWKSR
jgi:Rrf2 family protein